MQLTLEKKTTFFFILSFIILTLILGTFYNNSQKIIAIGDEIMHIQKVISKSNDLLIDALNIETGFRGYSLSIDERFFGPFNSAKTKIKFDLFLL